MIQHIGYICDHYDHETAARCREVAQRLIRLKPANGEVVAARCKAHQTPDWFHDLDAGRCPTCAIAFLKHCEELSDPDELVYRGCAYAIDRLADEAECNLPA
jgi:hypothetical protein